MLVNNDREVKIICEMCGSSDFVKEDGAFVCQSCGTKYTADEARKLMAEVGDREKEKNDMAGDTAERVAERPESSQSKMVVTSEPKKKKTKFVVFGIAAVVILILVALLLEPSAASVCAAEGCSEKKMENSEYCSTHTCHAEDCVSFAENGEYCSEHTCKVKGCKNPVVEDASYCAEHKCKEEGCNKKESTDGYCSTHALEQSGLPTNLIEYARYYGESDAEILKNFTYGGVCDLPDSALDGCLKYYYKQAQGYYLVETWYPYSVYYAERNNAGVSTLWQNGAPADEVY